ncbi:hypothetical protein F4782DRAFT_127062 [Xylaria castorea]|nr:hypothetical protein F4782DRAFT_127062 [Xylaria castorea]
MDTGCEHRYPEKLSGLLHHEIHGRQQDMIGHKLPQARKGAYRRVSKQKGRAINCQKDTDGPYCPRYRSRLGRKRVYEHRRTPCLNSNRVWRLIPLIIATGSTKRSQPSASAELSFVVGVQHTGLDDDAIYATSSSGMFPVNGLAVFDETDNLSFLADVIQMGLDADPKKTREHCIDVQTIRKLLYIKVQRGANFADNLRQDFFPRTFPTLFSWGKDSPKAMDDSDSHLRRTLEPASNHSLSCWARYVLQQHGGQCASHLVFCFLIFTMLFRSSNRRITRNEMRKTGYTTNPDTSPLH